MGRPVRGLARFVLRLDLTLVEVLALVEILSDLRDDSVLLAPDLEELIAKFQASVLDVLGSGS